MKKVTMGLGVVVVALAGGVMFCGDAFEETPSDTIVHTDTNDPGPDDPTNDDAEKTKGWKLQLTVASEDSPRPSLVAFKDGRNGWRHPSVDGQELALEVYDPQQRYSVLTACDFEDEKGNRHVDLTLLEATVAELSKPRLVCRTGAEQARDVQLSGAVRGTGGQDVDIVIGSRRFTVENEKQADGVLFATDIAKARHAFVATQGNGEKAKVAVTRGVDVNTPTANVEIDMAETLAFTPADLSLLAGDNTLYAGGRSFIWLDGRTRLAPAPMRTASSDTGYTLTTRTTTEPRDVLDITAQFRVAKRTVDGPPPVAAQARILTSGDAKSTVVLPSLHWAKPSEVRVHDKTLEVAWNPENWSVFGYDAEGDLALYMPTAYVARVTQETNARRTLDIVVTPNRATGPVPTYTVPDFNEIEHFDEAWAFRPSADLAATAGNLTANAGTQKVFGNEAIAAYLESEAVHGPANFMTPRTFTTLVTGLPPIIVNDTTPIADLRAKACEDASECTAKLQTDPRAIEVCDQLSTYRTCDALGRSGVDFVASPADFASDLKREVASWYVSQNITFRDDARSMDDALAAIDESHAKQMEPLEFGEYFSYDLDKYQVFYHVDTVYPDSRAVWYGGYFFGRLVNISVVNLDYERREFLSADDVDTRNLTVGDNVDEALLDRDFSALKDAWPSIIPPQMTN